MVKIKNIISLVINSYFAELEDQKENFLKVTRNPGYTAKDVMLVALLLENFILHLNLQKANWVYKHIILKNMKNWVCNLNFFKENLFKNHKTKNFKIPNIYFQLMKISKKLQDKFAQKSLINMFVLSS